MSRTSSQMADTAVATAIRSTYTVAFRLLGDEAEAGAATLAAVEAVSRELADGAPEPAALAKLRRAAVEEAGARLRSRGLQSRVAREPHRRAATEGAEDARSTVDAVLALPDALRAVFVLRAVERLDDDTVARLLGLDPSDVGELWVMAVVALRGSEAGGENER